MPLKRRSGGYPWRRYFNAAFPMGSMELVSAELGYFTAASEKSLIVRPLCADAITPSRDSLYDTLAEGDFDVLHITPRATTAIRFMR